MSVTHHVCRGSDALAKWPGCFTLVSLDLRDVVIARENLARCYTRPGRSLLELPITVIFEKVDSYAIILIFIMLRVEW